MKYNGAFNHMTGAYNTPNGDKWEKPGRMEYREIEKEITRNRAALMATKDEDARRAYIGRNHDLMTEMDRRWK